MLLAAAGVSAAGPHDGTYAGTMTNLSGAGCGESGRGSRIVTNGTFTNQWAGSSITIKVAADGTIEGSASVGSALVSAKGKIAGGVMTYEISSQRCAFRFEGKKR